ncbi:MAG TPA: amino acid adenylation domain-containing protein [Polyangia bacterium]|nr:amino acid adenylation domain-containing protein [Polyangia bacterium]
MLPIDGTHRNFNGDTLVALLRHRATSAPTQRAYTFLLDGEETEQHLTYAELDERARAIGATLLSRGAGAGRVVLLFPSGLDYIAAFFGCLYAGAVAVPAYPPDPARLQRTLPRLQAIVADAQAHVVLTTTPIAAMATALAGLAPDLAGMDWIAVEQVDEALAQTWSAPPLDGGHLAFLQYTSGSTGTPKGVMLTHANLLHNERLIQAAFGVHADSVAFGWLPLYHDMGLIGNVLQPLYAGCSCVLMSPIDFLRRPYRWLRGITRYRATVSGGPNFAYDLCARKITPEERRTLDLSSLTVAFNGAEPLRHDTLARFADTFAACGFRREAFFPCYGLAEAALLVTCADPGAGITTAWVDEAALADRRVVLRDESAERARRVVGSGRVIGDQRVLVVDPQSGRPCTEGAVGEVWISSPSVARGYWSRAEATRETFGAHLADTHEGPFLRTGDMGFFLAGELFIAGRLKDLIILRGKNHYPQDIERTVEASHPALRRGCVAAFALDLGGEEQLGIAVEVAPLRDATPADVIASIRQALWAEHELSAHAIALLQAGSIPKTSSGKIQRYACRDGFSQGTLEEVARGVLAPLATAIVDAPPLPPDVHALSEASRPEAVAGYLQERIAYALRVSPTEVSLDRAVTSLGIDSIAAIELTHDLEEHFGVVLGVTTFMQEARLSDVVEMILQALAAPRATPRAATAAASPSEAPLSPGQAALWFLHELDPTSTAYHLSCALRITSALNVDAMRGCWQTLVDRHAILRTTYGRRDGAPVQRVQAREAVALDLVDARTWSEEDLRQTVSAESQRPFDLERGPVLRIRLYTRPAGEHVMWVALHHIAADLWTLMVLLDELRQLYPAACSGRMATLPVLPRGYLDFVRWQAETLAGPEGSRSREYWKARLASPLPELALPTDRPRPPQKRFRGASIHFHIDDELTRALSALAAAESTTLYVVLLAAFGLFLARSAEQEDVIVGSPTTGRTHAGFDRVAGYFVNPLPMRLNLSGQPSVRELIARTRKTVLEALDHQALPLSRIVEELGMRRDPSRSPLFDALFVLEKSQLREQTGLSQLLLGTSRERVDLGGLAVEAYATDDQAAQFDLTLSMVQGPSALSGSLQYSTDLFEPETAARLVQRFETLLRRVVTAPQAKVTSLSLLQEAELDRLLAWSQGPALPPYEGGAHELFEAQAALRPAEIALQWGDATLTYAELDAAAHRLAQRLRANGVERGVAVATLLERSFDSVVAPLAILKAGGVYVPLDPAHPAQRLSTVIAEVAAPIVLVQERTRPALPDVPGTVLSLDGDDERIGRASAPTWSRAAADDAAYVLFTSGSTGTPKGVVIPHRGITNHVLWMQSTFPLSEQDRVLHFTPATFDVSIWELLGPLAVGARLVIAPPDVQKDGARLAELLGAHDVTVLQIVPSLLRVLLAEPAFDRCPLRLVFCGGEPMPPDLPRHVYARFPALQLCNAYGPTEASIDATCWPCPHEATADTGVPIGRPIANAQALLLDRYLQPVPIGMPGDLYLGGRGLALGYLGRPELTAASFVPHPFADSAQRLYKTGDRARWRATGVIEFLGRSDGQIKLRGQRIELGEIEAVLRRHPAVTEAVVVVHRDDRGGERLLAYLIPRPVAAGTEDEDELRAFLAERLPAYMVPSSFVTLDAFPLTAHGKLDRRALPAPTSPTQARGIDTSHSPTEQIVAAIWSEVLGCPVGSQDDFFASGGHSLLATQVVSRLRNAFHVDLPVTALFAAPTVAALAAHIDAQTEQHRRAVPLRRVPRDRRLPLSPMQERIFAIDRWLWRAASGSPLYNMPAALKLRGALDRRALERAITDLVARHETLRTSFTLAPDGPSQLIHPATSWTLPVEDLASLPAKERVAAVDRIAREEALVPFDLTRGPLLRTRLLRLADDEHVFLFTLHHIISDGWSMAIIAEELSALYNGHRAGAPPLLSPLDVQYIDFVAWQEQWLSGTVREQELGYWVRQLAGAPVLELPLDRPRPTQTTFEGQHLRFSLDAELSAALERLSRAHGATLFMTLLALFQALLHTYSGQDDLCVATSIAGRPRTEFEGLVGFFINRLILRARVAPGETFSSFLQHVRDTTLAGYAHQDVPFDSIVDALGLTAHPSRSPLCQSMFVLQNMPRSDLCLDGLDVEALEIETGTSKFDLALVMSEGPAGLTGLLEYKTHLFDEASMAVLAQRFERLARTVVQDPGLLLSQLRALDEQGAPRDRRHATGT